MLRKAEGGRAATAEGGKAEGAGRAAAIGALTLAARVTEPTSGRIMEVRTTEPGIQFYSGNFLDGTIKNRKGVTYSEAQPRSAWRHSISRTR